jgi:hypothetical protein
MDVGSEAFWAEGAGGDRRPRRAAVRIWEIHGDLAMGMHAVALAGGLA